MQPQMMQQHSMMAYANHPGNVTTDLIQQYLDENKQLILAILDNQNSGKLDECALNQAKLQRNLMYLAAIADSQPQIPTVTQFPPNPLMQSSSRYMQPPPQPISSAQPLMMSRSPMLYAQSPFQAMQQQQQHQQHQQQDLHSQLGMGGSSELHMLPVQGGLGGVFSDFGRRATKQEMGGGAAGTSEGRGGDGSEPLYLKSGSDEAK
ncbi:SSXT family protein isoform X2 [Wolffia australiana]